MPPKRKALSETTPNKRQARASKKAAEESPIPPNTKDSATQTSQSSNSAKPPKKGAKKKSAKSKDKDETPSKKSDDGTSPTIPSYQNLQWPNIGEFIDDKDQDMPKDGELLDEWCHRVSDLGIPISNPGALLFEKLCDEAEKRDQDISDLHIYSDWTGWGVTEIMCNFMNDYNRSFMKKNLNPHELWTHVEAFTCFIKCEDTYMMWWMGNEDGESVAESVGMTGTMVLTALEALFQHGLLKPDSEIKNIPIMCLMLLEFLAGDATDLDCHWGCEVVRLCDHADINLDESVRKQVSVTKKNIEDLREEYREKEASERDKDADGEINGYKAFARKKDWKPQDYWNTQLEFDPERLWYRWVWKTEFKEFKKDHPGGNHYDLTKKRKAFLKHHSLLD